MKGKYTNDYTAQRVFYGINQTRYRFCTSEPSFAVASPLLWQAAMVKPEVTFSLDGHQIWLEKILELPKENGHLVTLGTTAFAVSLYPFVWFFTALLKWERHRAIRGYSGLRKQMDEVPKAEMLGNDKINNIEMLRWRTIINNILVMILVLPPGKWYVQLNLEVHQCITLQHPAMTRY